MKTNDPMPPGCGIGCSSCQTELTKVVNGMWRKVYHCTKCGKKYFLSEQGVLLKTPETLAREKYPIK